MQQYLPPPLTFLFPHSYKKTELAYVNIFQYVFWCNKKVDIKFSVQDTFLE